MDNGKPWAEARGLVMSAVATARYFAAVCEVSGGELPPRRQPELMTISTYQPIGVIAAITPWNSPIASDMQKIAPAIAAGNAVILKPAEATPLISLKLAELFEQAGLPSGLLSVLPGKGSIVGDALVRHPLVKKSPLQVAPIPDDNWLILQRINLSPRHLNLGENPQLSCCQTLTLISLHMVFVTVSLVRWGKHASPVRAYLWLKISTHPLWKS